MNFKSAIEEDVLVVRIIGDIVGEYESPELLKSINEQLANGTNKCVLNIESVRFINSSGMGLLITILTKCRNSGGDLMLIHPSEHVKKLLIMTKLENIFNIAASEEEAIQKLKS